MCVSNTHSVNVTHDFSQHLAIVGSTFDPPEGQAPYSYVFDLSGEIRWDRPEQVWTVMLSAV